MQNVIAMKKVENNPVVIHATVKSVGDENVIIETDFGVISARLAFSCFLKPEVNDLVLADYSENHCYVLSVLERNGNSDVEIQYPATVNMRSSEGDINICSDKDIRLLAKAKSTFISDETSFISDSINVLSDSVNSRAEQVRCHVKNIHIFAESMDVVADQVRQRANTLIRWVESLESSNIGNLMQRVRHTLTSHSKQSVVTAEKDMRIDAERIHMG